MHVEDEATTHRVVYNIDIILVPFSQGFLGDEGSVVGQCFGLEVGLQFGELFAKLTKALVVFPVALR